MDYKNRLEQRIEHKVTDYLTKGVKILFFVIFLIGVFFLAGYILQVLWNWLMPDLFGVPMIRYWQALGLLVLAKIIFGFGGSGGSSKKTRHKSKARGRKYCNTLRNDFSEWKHYDSFWKEEGEAAFKAYVNKKQNGEGTREATDQ